MDFDLVRMTLGRMIWHLTEESSATDFAVVEEASSGTGRAELHAIASAKAKSAEYFILQMF